MKFQVTKNTQIYGLQGNRFKNLRLEASGVYQAGATFEGDVRYLRLPTGFKEVVKIDKSGPRAYVSTMNVKASNFSNYNPAGYNSRKVRTAKYNYSGWEGDEEYSGVKKHKKAKSVKVGDELWINTHYYAGGTGNCGEHKQYTCSYGCCNNDCCPKPPKDESANKGKAYSTKDDAPKSSVSGDWGVQAGQVFQFGKQQNPYHLQGGEIEGLVETDSHMLDQEGDWVDATGGWDSDRDWVDAKGSKKGDCGSCSKSENNCKSGCTCPDDVGYNTARCSPSSSSVQQNGKTKKMSRELSNASGGCGSGCIELFGKCWCGGYATPLIEAKASQRSKGNPLKRKKGKSSAKGVTGTRGKFGYDSKLNYSGDDDIYSVQPGRIAPFEAHNNPYSVSAGEIEGDDATMPESYEY